MPDSQPVSNGVAPPPLPRRAGRAPALAAEQEVLQSSTLLGPRQAIEIEHNGQRYRLQSTKSGKLILTK